MPVKQAWNAKDMAAWQKIAQNMGVAPKPAAPAPDPVVAQPDATYLATVAANNQRLTNLQNQYPGLVKSASADYGYQTDVNPDGSYSIGGVDPNNPYSRAALLQRSYEASTRGNTNSSAARGQLYAGSLQNAQNASTDNFQASSSGLQRSFSDLLRGYYNNVKNAEGDTGVANAQALGAIPVPTAPTTVSYAGVPYTPNVSGGYAAPVGTPTVASVLQSQSLLGTNIAKAPSKAWYKKRGA